MSEDRGESKMAVMPLGEHLAELRRRVIVCLLVVAAAFIVSWIFRERLIAVLVWPHVRAMRAFELNASLKFQSYLEPLIAQMKACAVTAIAIGAPVIIYQLWAFVAPGLFPGERRKAVWLGAACFVCFFGGICFGYFLFVPVALRYLLLLAGGATEPVLMIGSYLATFFLLTLALGTAFQTPIVIYFLIRWRIVSVEGLHRARKGVILGAFVVAAFLTPPDPLTQVMMAVTLIVLFDLGALAAAPSRSTILSFLQFTGVVVLVAAAVLGWYGFRSVAEVAALRGEVAIGQEVLKEGQSARVRRGTVCSTAAGSLARLTFGSGERVTVHLAQAGRVTVHGPRTISLHAGECLIENRGKDTLFTVHAGPATAIIEAGRAELSAPDADTLTVTVFEGEVTAKAEGVAKRISAGQTLTLHGGGELADLSEPTRRWQERMQQERPNRTPKSMDKDTQGRQDKGSNESG